MPQPIPDGVAIRAAGGHMRMEDNAFISKGVFAESNAQQVMKARRLVEELGASLASPAQARQILGVKACGTTVTGA
ncbi:3-keto-5-aminohexanoate cleavage protein [Variovorax sp. MHTC-1]|uniref:3-keto-5-aminohexanoate cleavage protein n=1 Tax=Variovorax sp. MHTC-1 TaxID=2495593 RepID=UPI0021AF13A6|nr:3-keto-5-aminohexanoate cleavage protein [Variovorax sp. MHTC-1]